ncbi:MAG: hypothetical protein Tsb0014_12770 [Pleurocapsa sp.]
MIFKSIALKPEKPQIDQNQDSKFSFKLYGLIASLVLGTVGGINWLVDPLWYSHGNLLTGRNFAFNERITKTNLFLRTKDKVDYDCLILGSSRAIALRPSNFQENQCFNYALKGGEIDDFINYSRALKEKGFNPKKVYIGVDGLNFVPKTRIKNPDFNLDSTKTQSPLQAYLSADVFLFSIMTLLGVSPDPGNYYDRNFEPADFAHPPVYKPTFYKPLPSQQCDLAPVTDFASLRDIFPNAEFIGYVPPRSAWSMVNDTYGRDLMDCYLTAFHQLSQIYDVMYDFSIPSEITKNPDHTFDGSHYSVEVNNEVAAILQGESDSFGIRINSHDFQEYRRLYFAKLREFLAENNQLKRWQPPKDLKDISLN